MKRERPYRTLSSEYLWQSHWYNVRQDRLRAADGSEAVYTVIEKPAAVWIVPVTDDSEIILIEQYRYPVDDWCLEIPAGNIEPGASPEAMAAQELAEEIGGHARAFEFVQRFYSLNGICDEVSHVYVARGVTLSAPQREATEHIYTRRVPVEEALRMAAAGEINDGPSALSILLSEPVLRAALAEDES